MTFSEYDMRKFYPENGNPMMNISQMLRYNTTFLKIRYLYRTLFRNIFVVMITGDDSIILGYDMRIFCGNS